MIIAIVCAAGRIMSTLGLPFAAINTDWRELETCAADRKLPIGEFGHGAGANPMIGAQAAEDAAEAIATLCTEPVLLVAGLGAGTGTGAAPVVARIAKAQDCEVTAVVTWPLPFESRQVGATGQAWADSTARIRSQDCRGEAPRIAATATGNAAERCL